MEKFRTLGVSEPILKALQEEAIDTPTEIQEKAIPLVIEGYDVIAESATGSGKTLAFGAGIIQHIHKGQGIQSLILVPTRELAAQVKDSLQKFAKHYKINVCTIYGGVSYGPQERALQRSEIVVGTPGRILDHLNQGTIDLSQLFNLTLDEADRMLDMGFLPDVKKIMGHTPTEKQTLLFSATMAKEIKALAARFMYEPEHIEAETYVDPSKLSQVYYDVSSQLKLSLLVKLLKEEQSGLVMIFCNSRRSVDFVEKALKKTDIDAIGIHGGLTQNKRDRIIQKFHSNDVFVLVCTDVAARGLDIPAVSHVYNYDIPNDSKQYVHRIGRTARAGRSGQVINLLTSRDHDNFRRVLRENSLDVERLDVPKLERLHIKINDEKPKRTGNMRKGPSRHSDRGQGRHSSRGSSSAGRGQRTSYAKGNNRSSRSSYSPRRQS